MNDLMEEYGKDSIKVILMRRDELDEDEALELIKNCQIAIDATISADICELEEIIYDFLGLEPDYLECFLY